jgi:hypothetical protein
MIITAQQIRELFCKKILQENKDVFSQIDILITQAIHKNNSKIIIKYIDDLSKDINDNILEVLKIYGYDISTWYVHEIRTGANKIPHIIDIPAGYIISWKV